MFMCVGPDNQWTEKFSIFTVKVIGPIKSIYEGMWAPVNEWLRIHRGLLGQDATKEREMDLGTMLSYVRSK